MQLSSSGGEPGPQPVAVIKILDRRLAFSYCDIRSSCPTFLLHAATMAVEWLGGEGLLDVQLVHQPLDGSAGTISMAAAMGLIFSNHDGVDAVASTCVPKECTFPKPSSINGARLERQKGRLKATTMNRLGLQVDAVYAD